MYIFTFLNFRSVACRINGKVHKTVSFFLRVGGLWFSTRSGLLARIRWSVCISKSLKILWVSFSGTNSCLCIYHLWLIIIIIIITDHQISARLPDLVIKKVKLAIVVQGDQKAPFSIATTPRCREGRYSFFWIAPLYPWYVTYICWVLSKEVSSAI